MLTFGVLSPDIQDSLGISFSQRMVWRSPCPREDEDNACYVPVGAPYRMAA